MVARSASDGPNSEFSCAGFDVFLALLYAVILVTRPARDAVDMSVSFSFLVGVLSDFTMTITNQFIVLPDSFYCLEYVVRKQGDVVIAFCRPWWLCQDEIAPRK